MPGRCINVSIFCIQLVGEHLLADRGDQDRPLLTVGREVEEMTGNTLADRAEDVARECLENLVQPPSDLFGERPSERRISLR
jgi:hypothetical protein